MIIGPSLGAEARNGRAVRISARSTDATVRTDERGPTPASDAAPPSTAAVMLCSASVSPICALPIGERAMTKNDATAANRADSTSARTWIQLVLTPPRFADRSSNPTARSCEARAGGVEPVVERDGRHRR